MLIFFNKYLGHEPRLSMTQLSMTNFIFRKWCKMGGFYQNTESLLPVMHPVKFDKEDKIAEALTMKNY